MKIYIIGPAGSGKTTLSKILSRKYDISCYELDCIVYDDLDNHRKRTDEEIKDLFQKIIKEDNWIIEDVGRRNFLEGRELCDTIYYLKLSRIEVYKRVIFRWIKQRVGKESYNYPPTFYQLFDMIRITHRYFRKEKKKLEELSKYKEKVIFLDKSKLNKIKKSDK